MLPAEWEPQRFVQLTWPHEDTDWAPYLESAVECFTEIARQITKREALLVVTPEPDQVYEHLEKAGIDMSQVVITECPTNDTWARDHAFITSRHTNEEGEIELYLNDFTFNGWGLKFAANLDNRINRTLWDNDILCDDPLIDLGEKVWYNNCLNYVLEGGSIESDGKGTILTTTECLLSDNRNGIQCDEGGKLFVQEELEDELGIKRMLWLDHGFLVGDDTDSHVDTLARMCPNDTIVYVQCTDTEDIHYDELHAMEEQLKGFRTTPTDSEPEGHPYRLLPLPMPRPILESDFPDAVEEEGDQRLPATYANFLIINGAVLYPTYNQKDLDDKASEVLKQAFPDREIVGIDCRVLIRQHGSLHCVTMQYPTL